MQAVLYDGNLEAFVGMLEYFHQVAVKFQLLLVGEGVREGGIVAPTP